MPGPYYLPPDLLRQHCKLAIKHLPNCPIFLNLLLKSNIHTLFFGVYISSIQIILYRISQDTCPSMYLRCLLLILDLSHDRILCVYCSIFKPIYQYSNINISLFISNYLQRLFEVYITIVIYSVRRCL